MKRNVETSGKSVQLLKPDYKKAVEIFAGLGLIRSEDDVYLSKVTDKYFGHLNHRELCYCIDFYDGKKREFSPFSQTDYLKRVACISFFGNKTVTFAAQDIELEVLKPGSIFEYDAVRYEIPHYQSDSTPYVLSQADALELFHKFGFMRAELKDVFVGTFSFVNPEAEKLYCPEAQKHFGIGVSFMLNVEVDSRPSVAVIRAFNEMIPKTVICTPVKCAVVRPFMPHDSFKTVCGEMALINGIMVNYGHWLKERLNQIHDACSSRKKLQFC